MFIRTIINIVILFNLFTINAINAKSFEDLKLSSKIDLYRSTQINAEDIYKTFKEEFNSITNIHHMPDSLASESNFSRVQQLLTRIVTGIQAKGNFAYVNVGPIYYPDTQEVYFSIDVVDNSDKYRLSYFLPAPTKIKSDPDHLIADWLAYQKEGFKLAYTTTTPLYKHCPAYHCMFGFEHPKLQKYKDIFNKVVQKNKSKLVEILREDSSAEKRAAAAFLIAHLNDGNEIVDILAPSMFDSDSLVRNNVMRVMAQTLSHVKTNHFPIANLAKILDFPKATDRNKATCILYELADQTIYAKYMIKNMSKQLLILLSMSQPNIHDTVYGILKRLSGKNFSDRDYENWKKWLDSKQAA